MTPFNITNRAVDDSVFQVSDGTSQEFLEKFQSTYKFDINPDLTSEQRYELLNLLYKYKDVFAKDLLEIKACKNYEMDIPLRTNRKIYKRQYRLNQEDTAEADRQISQMLKAGIIEESQDMEYNSPYFLVAKKNGTKRLVVDLRAINEIIVPKLVQIPKITHLIEEITSQKPTFLSSIDLFSGFWQVPIRQRARPVTSFIAPTGIHYQFTRTPFGLCNSSHALASALLGLFSDKQRFRNLYLYVDDILAIASSFPEHLTTLEVMLENLKSNDFTCNPEKFSFCYSELEYLGYRISANSIRISKRRVDAVTKIQPPKNVKGLQRLMGLFNFFKRHIPKYAHKTARLLSVVCLLYTSPSPRDRTRSRMPSSA